MSAGRKDCVGNVLSRNIGCVYDGRTIVGHVCKEIG